jgi:hypothetical protein
MTGVCLYVMTIEGNAQGHAIQPIWPIGFSAKIGPRTVELYSRPGQENNAFAVASQRMELQGEFVDTPPDDAQIRPECARYPLFLVGEAVNRS